MDAKEQDKSLIDFTPPKEKTDSILPPSNVRGIVSQEVLYGDKPPKQREVKWVTRAQVVVPGHIAMDPY